MPPIAPALPVHLAVQSPLAGARVATVSERHAFDEPRGTRGRSVDVRIAGDRVRRGAMRLDPRR